MTDTERNDATWNAWIARHGDAAPPAGLLERIADEAGDPAARRLPWITALTSHRWGRVALGVAALLLGALPYVWLLSAMRLL